MFSLDYCLPPPQTLLHFLSFLFLSSFSAHVTSEDDRGSLALLPK